MSAYKIITIVFFSITLCSFASDAKTEFKAQKDTEHAEKHRKIQSIVHEEFKQMPAEELHKIKEVKEKIADKYKESEEIKAVKKESFVKKSKIGSK